MQLWIPHDVPTVQKDGWAPHVKIYAYTVTRSLWIAENVGAMHAIQEEAAISSVVDMEHARTENVDAIRWLVGGGLCVRSLVAQEMEEGIVLDMVLAIAVIINAYVIQVSHGTFFLSV